MVEMIRNYQRSGGGSVDLVPIYNSISQLQNEVNSLITLTQLSTLSSISTGITAFTGSIYAVSQSVNMLVQMGEQIELSMRSNKSSINSLSSSVMDINSIISTLTAGGGGGGDITLTNPTESGHVFTNPVLYTGPNDMNTVNYGPRFMPYNNTYLKGVTWRDAPSTTNIYGRTFPAFFENCVIYGNVSYENVYNFHLIMCTGEHAKIHNCTIGSIDAGSYTDVSINNLASEIVCYGTIGTLSAQNAEALNLGYGSFNSIVLSDCNIASMTKNYVNHFYVPGCSVLSLSSCRVKDLSIEYPSTVTEYNSDYVITLNANTIDKLNASLLRHTLNNNDIWTANIYMDYDLMQSSVFTSAGYFNGNTINELSIFNNDHGTGNTTNKAISLNGLYLGDNSLRQMVYDLYSPLTISHNTIDTLANTLGVSLSANGNYVQEWGCEVSPYSAQLYESVSGRSFAMISSNTIGKVSFTHGLNDESFSTDSESSATMFGLNQLSIYVLNNSVDYVTFDVLNPLTMGFKGHLYSAHVNLANDITFAATESVGTIDIVKNERFVTGARDAEIRGFYAHSMGMTNVYPRFVNVPSVDILNMYIDGPMSTNYALAFLTANSVNINNFASMSVVSSWIVMSQCSIEFFDYEQLNTNRIRFTSNTIDYCSITGGNLIGYSCDIINMNLNINAADMRGNTLSGLGGTAKFVTLDNNSLTLGGFYYSVSGGSGNSIARLSTGMQV